MVLGRRSPGKGAPEAQAVQENTDAARAADKGTGSTAAAPGHAEESRYYAGHNSFAPGFDTRSAWITLVFMTLGMLASNINATTMSTSLGIIMGEFGISPSAVQWLITSYMLVLGIVTPLSAYLVSRHHMRKLFCGALAVFVAGAILGAVQQNFWVLIVARVIQALGSGVTVPTLQIMVYRIFPFRMRGMVNGFTMSAVAIAPAIGPVLAGALTDTIGWRSIFWVTGGLALISLAGTRHMLRRMQDHLVDHHLDKMSFVLSTLIAVGIVFGCSNMGAFGLVSWQAWLPFVLGVGLIFVFARRELRVAVPLLDMRTLRCKPFVLTCVVVIFTQGYIVAINSLVCLYVQDVQALPATLSGLTMLPGAVMSMIFAPLAGRYLDRHGPRRVVSLGFFLIIVATWLLSTMTPATPLAFPMAVQTARFAGMACLQQVFMVWGISQQGDLSQATAVANTIRQLGGSATNALYFSVMDILLIAYGGSLAAEGQAITATFSIMNVTQVVLAAVALGLMFAHPVIKKAAVR